MKRIIAALLVLSMALAFAACGGDAENTSPIDVDPTTPSPSPVGEDPAGLGLKREYSQTMGMVAAGYIHSLGLRSDGTALSAGHDYYGQRRVSDWADVVYVAAGKSVSVGVKADDTLVFAGKLTDEAALAAASAWTNVFTADAGGDFVAALLNDGTVVAAGDNSAGQCDVSGWSDIVAIACGDAFTVGLTADGTVVATSGAPAAVTSWKEIKKIAAGGAAAVAGITSAGGLVTTLDVAADSGFADLVDIGADDCGVAGVRADGTVVTSLGADITYDPDYNYGEVDLSTVTDAVAISVGAKHVVVMRKDGSAAAYGVNDDLQCDVGRFNLRPYLEKLSDTLSAVRGLKLGMTVADAKALIAASAGAADAQFAKVVSEAETAVADTDLVATGMKVKCDGADYGTVVLLGDVDENGTVDAADREFIAKVSTNNTRPTGYVLRAAQLETNATGQPFCGEASLALVDAHIAGTARIGQFSKMRTGVYDQLLADAIAANKDTVGYIAIPKTNINYPIMFDATTGKWYYNDHTPEKKESESGSIYAYYYGHPELKNTVVTGHNSRPSGSMFHQLHHIQEFNLGNATCAQTKYCGKELKDLPDLKIYSNRVWTLTVFGEETRWEMFSMYETKPGDEAYEIWLDNIWWPYSGDYAKKTDEKIHAWLNKQIERSEIPFDTTVTLEDHYLTVFTCGNEHADSNKYARLFFIFKQVD